MRIPALVVSLFFITALAPRALAHARLDHSDPKVGGAVTTVPKTVRLWFTESLKAAASSVQVKNSDGKRVDKKNSHLDHQNQKLMIISVKSLPPGDYKVFWTAVALDGHKTEGHFKFTVKRKSR